MNQIIPPRPTPTPVTDKEAMAAANLAETEQAHKMAAEQKARDAQNEPPLIQQLQGSIKEKLENLPPAPEGETPAQ